MSTPDDLKRYRRLSGTLRQIGKAYSFADDSRALRTCRAGSVGPILQNVIDTMTDHSWNIDTVA